MHPVRAPHAFTLLETIAVIVITAILLALILPAIGRVRETATRTASLRNLGTHAHVASLYALDYKDFAPFIADPDATFSVVRGGGLTVEFEFFESSEAWIVALVDDYYELAVAENWQVFAYPGREPGLYQYSPSFIARPGFWNMRTRSAGQLGPNRMANVRAPSSKTIFLEFNPPVGFPVWTRNGLDASKQWGMGFVDGSARRLRSDQLAEPVSAGEGAGNGARFSVGVAGMHTVDGVLGRDVE